ncbi:hypothetical protein [Sphingobacterium haloxyli]|uniref:Uncharacterized protein n=1 Tax=Sphingobacterium haloxyli TaxID=2100533 RepID=A0A2S9IVI8_9SPHI|nr:hypothetical protein [Sphingobacterium haloxyli]PRD44537.1 hypothetical protein C5745_19355 [Sphingobacterium haloxyli]
MMKYIYTPILIWIICNFIACDNSASSVWLEIRADYVYRVDSIDLQVSGEHEIFIDTILKEENSRYPRFEKLLEISVKQQVKVIFNDVDTSFVVDPKKCGRVIVELTNMHMEKEQPENNKIGELVVGKGYEDIDVTCVSSQ